MLMKTKTVEITRENQTKSNGITLTRQGINNLNNRIKKEIQHNQEEYLHGLDNAKFHRNKSKEREL